MVFWDVYLLGAFVTVALGAAWDIRTGFIPNGLTAPLFALGVLTHTIRGIGHGRETYDASGDGLVGAATGLGLSLLGALLLAALPTVLFLANESVRGGDVKLLAAVGAWLLPRIAMHAACFVFGAAPFVLLATTAIDGRIGRVLSNMAIIVTNGFRSRANQKPIPRENLTLTRFGLTMLIGVTASILYERFLYWG